MRNIFFLVCILGGLFATAEEVAITHQCKPAGVELYSNESYSFVWTYEFGSPSATPVTAEDASLEDSKTKAAALSRIIFAEMRKKNSDWVGYSVGLIECRTKGVLDPQKPEFNLYSPIQNYPRPSTPLLNDERQHVARKSQGRS